VLPLQSVYVLEAQMSPHPFREVKAPPADLKDELSGVERDRLPCVLHVADLNAPSVKEKEEREDPLLAVYYQVVL
jgi:hypothetical protein